jgi:signal transduction histidine kinase
MWLRATDGGALRKSVLVVEDDDDIRVTLEAILREQGYDVAACANGRDALARLQGGALIDVIVLDLMMPVMDGWQFRVEQKRSHELSAIPVIAVTADRTAKAVAIDADACLTKPVDMNVLLATIDRVILKREREMIRARLVEADRLASLGTLAAGVAHEINNPLAYVLANVELISQEIGRGTHSFAESGSNAIAASRRERLHDAIAQVRDGLERIRTIVSDLKMFSSPAEGALVAVDVRRVLDSAANIVLNEVNQRAQLVKDYEDIPLVMANEPRLGQVFMNLIVNAAQALPEGAAAEHEIRLVTRTTDGVIDAGDTARFGGVEIKRIAVIEVHDTGSGIPDDIVGRIFEPFFTTARVLAFRYAMVS